MEPPKVCLECKLKKRNVFGCEISTTKIALHKIGYKNKEGKISLAKRRRSHRIIVLKSQENTTKNVAAKKTRSRGSHLVAVEKHHKHLFLGSAAGSVMLFKITHLTSPK